MNIAYLQDGPLGGEVRIGPAGEALRVNVNGLVFFYRWAAGSERGRVVALESGDVLRYYRVFET